MLEHTPQVSVLDKGYVRLVNFMGYDIDIVNAARASYEKESCPEAWYCALCGFEHDRPWKYGAEPPYTCPDCSDEDVGLPYLATKLNEKDLKLLRFLAREGHTSPFRHVWATFEVRAPLMVARQWWKHVVGGASIEEGTNWNESSRRYVTEEPEFYIPEVWRAAPEHKKQGSGGPVDSYLSESLKAELEHFCMEALDHYEWAIQHGVAPEQARLFLPAYAMYVRWCWTASLHAIIHFLKLREAEDAQAEIREYARAVHKLVKPLWPQALEAWGL